MRDSTNAKRLISALYRNIDANNIKALAVMLHYDERQLQKDIEALNNVIVMDKEEVTQ